MSRIVRNPGRQVKLFVPPHFNLLIKSCAPETPNWLALLGVNLVRAAWLAGWRVALPPARSSRTQPPRARNRREASPSGRSRGGGFGNLALEFQPSAFPVSAFSNGLAEPAGCFRSLWQSPAAETAKPVRAQSRINRRRPRCCAYRPTGCRHVCQYGARLCLSPRTAGQALPACGSQTRKCRAHSRSLFQRRTHGVSQRS